jgi:UMF1 family MFS transporter
LALGSRESISWALYDWANSAFATTIMAGVLPVYYASVAGAGLSGNTASVYWGYTTAVGLILIALVAPILGAIADYVGAKKRFLAGFLGLGTVFTALLFFTGRGQWLLTSVLFIAANVGFAGANIFYDSLLPHVAGDDSQDRLSSAGYALGYLGGGLLLVVNLAWIVSPSTFGISDTATASRLAMLSVAVWWTAFSIPLFLYVDEPEPRSRESHEEDLSPVRAGFGSLRSTFAEIRRYRQLFVFLLAFWLYADGIGTIIKMATVYGAEIGIGQQALIGALVLVQFLGIPFAFAFGSLADRIGTKRGIFLGLLVYVGVSVGGYFISEAWHFWVLAAVVATVQGGTQALSRSLYSSLVPPSQSSEFFSFFSISSKFAGIFGPLLFSVIGQATGSSRVSILSLLIFFVGGMVLLWFVDVDEGRRAAREAQAAIGVDNPGSPAAAADGGTQS